MFTEDDIQELVQDIRRCENWTEVVQELTAWRNTAIAWRAGVDTKLYFKPDTDLMEVFSPEINDDF